MRFNLTMLIVFLLVFASCKVESASTNQKIGIKKGDLSPNFEVVDINGKLWTQNTSNKPILLYFMASWCPFCKEDLEIANRIYPKWKDKVDFLIVSMEPSDDLSVLKEYQLAGKYNFMNFAPNKTEILKDYSVIHTTTKFAIASNRTILWSGSGVIDENIWEIIFMGLARS